MVRGSMAGWRSGGRRRMVPALLGALALLLLLPPAAHGLEGSQAAPDPMARLRALRDEGRLAEALAVATQAVQAEPGRRDLRIELGFLLGASGRYEEALAEYDRILAENPADVEALLEHAQLKTLLGRLDEAEGEFRYILALDPGAAGAAFGLGDVLVRKGDLAGAREAYLQYVRARPDDPRGHLRLADLALRAGKPEEARERFQEVLRLDPANREARAGLARLEAAGPTEYRFRFEIGYTHDTLTNGQPDWRQGAMLLAFRPWRGTEFTVSAQAVNRFGIDDQLVAVGFSQTFFEYVTLSGNFGQSLNNGRLLPKQIYEGQLAVPAGSRLQFFISYSFADFAGNVTAGTVSPGAQVSLPWRFSLLGRYYRTESTGNEPSNAYLVQVQHDTVVDAAGRTRFQPYLGFSHGGLATGALTAVELRSANSQFNSIFAGFAWRVIPRAGIKFDYLYQAVKHVYTRNSFGISTFVEF